MAMQFGKAVTRAIDGGAEYDFELVTEYERAADDEREVYSAVISAQNLGDRIDRMDVDSRYRSNPIVLSNHNRDRPIGSALRVKRERDTGAWVSDFVFAEGDAEADRIRNLWQQGTLRAVSIGFSTRKGIPVLHEFSIVPIGLDEMALARDDTEGSDMTDDEKGALGPKCPSGDAAPWASQGDDAVKTRVVDDLEHGNPVRNRDANSDALDNWDSDEPPEIEVVNDSSTSEGFNAQQMTPEGIDLLVKARVAEGLRTAMLRERVKPLLPKDFAGDDLTEMLRAAVGNGVSELESRSIDYLEGRLDVMLEKRAAASDAYASVVLTTTRTNEVHASGIQDIIRLEASQEVRDGIAD